MSACRCGCGEAASAGNRYISGHNLRHLKRTPQHRRHIAEGLKRAWKTKRKRLPLGSTYVDLNGYIRVKVVVGAGRWMPEHIIIMEKHLGRKLRRNEVIHHINHDRKDNRLRNLYLCSDHREHMLAQGTISALIRPLMEAGLLAFNRKIGAYELP